MILDDPEYYWIYVVPSDPFAQTLIYKGKKATKEDYLDHWGKWVIMDDKERLDELAADLDIAVERRWIPQIKYTRYPAPEMGLEKCVMAVFCDDRERGDILQFLLVAGAMPQGWEYEKDMVESWKPGGVFLERVIAAKGLTGEEAKRFREGVPKQMEAWIEYTFGTGEKAKKLRESTFKTSGLILSAEDMNLIVDEKEKETDTGTK